MITSVQEIWSWTSQSCANSWVWKRSLLWRSSSQHLQIDLWVNTVVRNCNVYSTKILYVILNAIYLSPILKKTLNFFIIKTLIRTEEENQFQTSLESQMTTWSSKPCLQIELENEDHGSVKEVKISGKAVASL